MFVCISSFRLHKLLTSTMPQLNNFLRITSNEKHLKSTNHDRFMSPFIFSSCLNRKFTFIYVCYTEIFCSSPPENQENLQSYTIYGCIIFSVFHTIGTTIGLACSCTVHGTMCSAHIQHKGMRINFTKAKFLMPFIRCVCVCL